MPTSESPRHDASLPLIGDRRPAVVAGDFNAVDEVEVIREFGAAALGRSGWGLHESFDCPRISGWTTS